jgi:hypothetical protein
LYFYLPRPITTRTRNDSRSDCSQVQLREIDDVSAVWADVDALPMFMRIIMDVL